MAKLDRKDVKIFAENSKETLITEFRTEDSQGSTASFSRDPDVIQNENYSQGWVNNTNNLNTKIYGEDLNAVNYVLSYLLKYLYENGIAEWKSTTTYYQNSICKVNNALYLSLQDNNIGNDPTSTVSYWKPIPLENVSIENSGNGLSIVKDVTDNVITFKTISVTGYGEITDNGDQLNIDIAGGGGGGTGDAYWGTIRGTITNQTDLMALINLKQDIFTVSSPLVLTDDHKLTINKATSSVSGYLDYNDFNTFNGKQDTISATLPISIANNNIKIETANTLTTGVLSYTDWNTFNNKQDALSFNSPLSKTSNTISISKADRTTDGYLTSTDWNTFNNKQNAITASSPLSLSNNTLGIAKASSSASGYLSNTDWNKFNNKVSANNSTINIKMNGVNKGSFTTNASSGATIDLGTVITNTNDCAKLAGNNTFTGTNKLGNVTISAGNISRNDGSIFVSPSGELRLVSDTQVRIRCSATGVGSSNNFRYYGKITAGKSGDENPISTYAGSDIRLKKDIKEATINGIETINKINVKEFRYKTEDEKHYKHIGVIAQEVEKEVPEIKDVVLHGEDDEKDMLVVEYGMFTPYLIKAVQELSAKVEKLEARIKELEK